MNEITETREGWAKQINERWTQTVASVFETARVLHEAKQSLPRQEFRDMLEKDLLFGRRKAEKLLEIAQNPELSDPKRAAMLPASWTKIAQIARLSGEELDWAHDEEIITPDTPYRVLRALTTGLSLNRDGADKTQPVGKETGTHLPTPTEARKLAESLGRPVVGSDGRYYTGLSQAETEAYQLARGEFFAIKKAVLTLSAPGVNPVQIHEDAPEWWYSGLAKEDCEKAKAFIDTFIADLPMENNDENRNG